MNKYLVVIIMGSFLFSASKLVRADVVTLTNSQNQGNGYYLCTYSDGSVTSSFGGCPFFKN